MFDGGDQFHRHIKRASAAALLEGQVPAGLGAAGPFEGREAAFNEGPELSDLAEAGRARLGVPVRNDHVGVHQRGLSRRLGFPPRGLLEGLAEQLVDLPFQGVIVADAFFAFAGLFGGEGFGGPFSLKKTSPAVIGAVEPGWFVLAGAVGFAAGAASGGEAAGEQGQSDVEGNLFLLHVS